MNALLPWLLALCGLALGWWLAGRWLPTPLAVRLAHLRLSGLRADPAGGRPRRSAVDRCVAWLTARLDADQLRAAAVRARAAGWTDPLAGARLAAARWLLPMLLPLCGGVVLLLREGSDGTSMIATMVLLGLAGRYAPDLLAANLMARRAQAVAQGLPDAIDLLVICAEAGLGIELALGRTGRELAPAQPALAAELLLTATELALLPSRAEAFANLARRVPLPPIAALADMLVQTERFGTPLAQSLRVLGAEYRTGRLLRAEEQAARLPALMTVPMIGFILPPLFIVLIGPAIVTALAG